MATRSQPDLDLPLRMYEPRPELVVASHEVARPRFPAIDAHNHLGETFGGGWDRRPVEELLAVLDEAGVTLLVDLDGGWGEHLLDAHLEHFKAQAPERFAVFGGVAWEAWPEHGDRFGEWAAARLVAQQRRGAQGLKIWKPLGLRVRDQHGRRVPVDDPRLDPLWQTAGELGLPVTIHVADPAAFFRPLDRHNERYEELLANPDWHFYGPEFPPFETVIGELARLVERHPETTFIGAHVGCYAENLGWVGALLERCPNFYVDISARIAELGRQPHTARKFFLAYPDRILFGMDHAPAVAWYRKYYRFLETDDDYFNPDLAPVPGQGRWYVSGLKLPDDVLERVYHKNSRRVLGLLVD